MVLQDFHFGELHIQVHEKKDELLRYLIETCNIDVDDPTVWNNSTGIIPSADEYALEAQFTGVSSTTFEGGDCFGSTATG